MLLRFFLSSAAALFAFFQSLHYFLTSTHAQSIPFDITSLKKLAEQVLDEKLAEAVDSLDVDAIYAIAKLHLDSTISVEESAGKKYDAYIKILHALADNKVKPHILSQVALGFFYYESGNPDKSLNYFMQAGESGPHQAALYNAGRILAEQSDWISALAYMQGAITLQRTHPNHVQSKLTDTCTRAYEVLSEKIALREEAELLSIEQMADLFLYASSNDFPNDNNEAIGLWKKAVLSLKDFNQTISESGKVDVERLDQAAASLRKLWETESHSMSKLQAHFVLKSINRVLSLLTAIDDEYLETAAGYAEALAISPFCSGMAAHSDQDQFKCFNQAVAKALTYYRRYSDMDGAKRIFDYAHQNPLASTSWKSIEQSPVIYSAAISNIPWHKPDEFSALTEALVSVKDKVRGELQIVKSLPEKRVYVPAFHTSFQASISVNENEITGIGEVKSSEVFGFQAIITQNVRSSKSFTGRAEFGPLFNGTVWNHFLCLQTPVLCQTMAKIQSRLKNLKIVRMQSGSMVLPHCGDSNTQLMFYYCIEGCNGVEITVAGTTVRNFNEQEAIEKGSSTKDTVVFDNSFVHSLVHNGPEDSYFVSATLSID